MLLFDFFHFRTPNLALPESKENGTKNVGAAFQESKFTFLRQCALEIPYKDRTAAQQAMLRIYMRCVFDVLFRAADGGVRIKKFDSEIDNSDFGIFVVILMF